MVVKVISLQSVVLAGYIKHTLYAKMQATTIMLTLSVRLTFNLQGHANLTSLWQMTPQTKDVKSFEFML